MASTTRTKAHAARLDYSGSLIWQSWPIVDQLQWAWVPVAAVFGVGIVVWFFGGGWLIAIAAMAGLATTLWSAFLPAEYEITSHGLRRCVMRRTRLVPWHAIRAYRLRYAGIVIYRRSDPGNPDLLRSMFVPYPPDRDTFLSAIRQHASHATELAQ